MAARNPVKTELAVTRVRAATAAASLQVVPLDLSSQSSVRSASAQILANHDRVDLLVNNAGVMAIPEGRTEDGFETHWP